MANGAEGRKQIRRQYLQEWHRKHPEYAAQQSARQRARNPEKERAYQWQWKKANPVKNRAYKRKFYLSHKDEWRRYTTRWKRKHRDRVAVSNHNSRLKRLGAPSLPDASLAIGRIMEMDNAVCIYCQKVCRPTVEHIMALASGGYHAAFNIAAACMECNLAKRATHPNQFIKTGQLLLVFYWPHSAK